MTDEGVPTVASGPVYHRCFAFRPAGSHTLYFLTERPAEDEEGQIYGEDVSVQPLDFLEGSVWPQGAKRPDQLLCVTKTQPTFFKVFKYRSELDDHANRFRETGLNFGGIYDLEWYKQIRGRVAGLAAARKDIEAMPPDPNETPEAWDEIMRNINR